MKKITVKPEMLEAHGLKIDMHEIAGWIDLTGIIENEPGMIIENILDHEDLDLSGKQWDRIVERVIGDDLDPYNITDLENLITEAFEYVIQSFLDITELHGVIDLVPREMEPLTREKLFCMGMDPFTVELTSKPYDLYKVWIEEVGGSVEIDRSRYGRHVTYTKDQAVTIEVIREIFWAKNYSSNNHCLLEDFDANNCVADYMSLDRYELLAKIVAPELG